MRNRNIDVIPDEIKVCFEVNDIPKVFDLLELYFKISPLWRSQFQQVLKQSSRDQDEREVFARFSKEHFDPALKHLLKREDSVIFSIMRYVVKDRVAARRKEQGEISDYYRKRK